MLCALPSDTLLPDDLVSSGIIDAACRDEVEDSEFESFDRLFSQLPAMKGELNTANFVYMQCATCVCNRHSFILQLAML